MEKIIVEHFYSFFLWRKIWFKCFSAWLHIHLFCEGTCSCWLQLNAFLLPGRTLEKNEQSKNQWSKGQRPLILYFIHRTKLQLHEIWISCIWILSESNWSWHSSFSCISNWKACHKLSAVERLKGGNLERKKLQKCEEFGANFGANICSVKLHLHNSWKAINFWCALCITFITFPVHWPLHFGSLTRLRKCKYRHRFTITSNDTSRSFHTIFANANAAANPFSPSANFSITSKNYSSLCVM
jgi:hypothetical protein